MSETPASDLFKDLSTLVERSQAGRHRVVRLSDQIIYDHTLPWQVRGWFVYHALSAYQRLCLVNSGLASPRLYARLDGERVVLVKLAEDMVLVNRRGDPDAALTEVRPDQLSDWTLG